MRGKGFFSFRGFFFFRRFIRHVNELGTERLDLLLGRAAVADDGLLDQFAATSDEAEQKAIAQQLQQVFAEEVPTLPLFPLYWVREVGASDAWIGGDFGMLMHWDGSAWTQRMPARSPRVGGSGLRAHLLAQVDPDLLTRIGRWAGFLSQGEVNDSVIRAVVSPRQQKMNQGSVYTDYGGQIEKTLPNVVTRGAGDLGLTMGSLGFFPAMDVVRQALPMVLSLLKMALVICIPLVLVFGTYELKALVAVSCVQFALFFVDFWFQLARWLDSTILDALYGWGFGANRPHSNFDPLIGLNNAFGDMLLNFVMATMFIVLPTFWVAALGWVGVRAGTAIQGLAAGTRDAQAAGGRGAGVAMKAAK